jgi:hypothetical protein
VEEQVTLLKLRQIHQRVTDAEPVELLAKLGIAFHPETDVVDRLGRAVEPCVLRADDVDDRMARRVEPVPGDVADGARSFAFFQIEDREEEAPRSFQISGADGDVIEVHVSAPFAMEIRAFTPSV